MFRPAIACASNNSSIIDSSKLSGFCKRHSSPKISDKTVAALIDVLLKNGSPAAVIRLIVTVVINAVNGQTVARLTHIFQEVFKHKPTLTDGYSSAAVVVKGRVRTAQASRLHVTPCFISLGFDSATCFTVSSVRNGNSIVGTFGRTMSPPSNFDTAWDREELSSAPLTRGFAPCSIGKSATGFGAVRTYSFIEFVGSCFEYATALGARVINYRHISPQSSVSNHMKMPGNKVIEVLLSAAKPIRAMELYLS